MINVRHRTIVSVSLALVATLAAAAATLLPARPTRADAVPRVFFGNLHAHTKYSDGSSTPKVAYTMARTKAHLDFLAITEHNHARAEMGAKGARKDGILIATDHRLYEGPAATALIPAAKAATVAGKFVALYGQEFSSIGAGNHVNVFDVGTVIEVPSGDFGGLLDWLGANLDSSGRRAVLQLNHPRDHDVAADEYGRDDFGSDVEWVGKMGGDASLIELLNGPGLADAVGMPAPSPMEKDFLEYLRLGFHVGPTGDQDNHFKNWGLSTDVRTGVVATELTKAALLEALRARHVYATEDKNLRAIFAVNGHLAGDRFAAPAPGSALDVRYSLSDDDEPDASYRIEVLAGKIGGEAATIVEAVAQEGDTPAGATVAIDDLAYGGGFQYFFFRITQESGGDAGADRAWIAPVWLEPGATPPAPPPAGDPARFVASKNSLLYHLSADCLDAKAIKPANKITGAAAAHGRTPHAGCPRK